MTNVPPPGWTRKPPPEGDGSEPPKKKRYWWRFSVASLIIVAVVAAATSSAILLYIDSIAAAIGTHENKQTFQEVKGVIKQVHGGEPETILIFGSDIRPSYGEEYGRSDTAILLRLDAQQNLISVMSIPRDLKTEIPNYGTNKFNAAYSFGGPKLAAQVVKEMTGLSVNHIVNIDFLGFVRAVDAIGCVYTDVDRRYYHSNVGVPPEEEYSEIDIKPGYQKLCGKKALEYVRYRHTDTDIVRSARQQNFLSQVRHQISPIDLITDDNNLIDILAEYTTSDIHEGSELITLLDLLYELKGAELNQVHFPATLGPSYVYSNPTLIHEAVREFLGETGFDAHREKSSSEKKHKKAAGSKHKGHKQKKKKKKHATSAAADELVPAPESGEEMGEKVARQVGSAFPVFYPTRLPPGAIYQEDDSYEHIVNPWVYHLRDKEKGRHGAYRMIGIYGPEYEPTYFGVQGIRGWEDPPILEDPTETVTYHGREYSIYTDSGKIKLVAWHRGENSYWISNSLQQSLTNKQMMGVAESCHMITPKRKTAKHGSKNE
jgi:polyisoprenyl-teichoic acid--peptidoglycan teichoic acid transferase